MREKSRVEEKPEKGENRVCIARPVISWSVGAWKRGEIQDFHRISVPLDPFLDMFLLVGVACFDCKDC